MRGTDNISRKKTNNYVNLFFICNYVRLYLVIIFVFNKYKFNLYV